ncbi:MULTISPECIES: hypothetical protein [unclassified Mucilaginibacter]|uniref:hypothetical protein n=1 Tax=unclassified Mucilaginibacter TaxID=2617802 RepID=UPI002AC9B7DF|nr:MULTISPECIES: hypothetical protein [unclassified Mucilaginibacter]MEB0261143.1 hypothetical protein [Mucilaginibacter sp. 10I4]MEB0280519.1 hypothetical protein [Mucilaginibacter sp. 10B2]MEB0301275.1 hypothetical protein [Mucilaginibacter sp. 5C4]WPX22493.1 hypothetical protein RHM67_14500 [Mucilaginibacter sp. 5C4]
MKIYAVVTGDIKNFTKLPDDRRSKLVVETEMLMRKMVKHPKDAQVFRGDSYQLLTEDVTQVLKRCIRLICWFKLNSDRFSLGENVTKKDSRVHLDTRLSIGIGEIAYEGKSVLDSDGEAFHLSGRNFDILNKDEIIRLNTFDEQRNEVYEMILIFINSIMKTWTPSQAETIFELLGKDDNTQDKIAKKLKMTQPAIASSLRAARWKEVEKGINYITKELEKQYFL